MKTNEQIVSEELGKTAQQRMSDMRALSDSELADRLLLVSQMLTAVLIWHADVSSVVHGRLKSSGRVQ